MGPFCWSLRFSNALEFGVGRLTFIGIPISLYEYDLNPAMVHVRPEVDQLVRSAISRRKQIRFQYKGKERISEPHDYGIQNGRTMLLTYQLSGQSNTGRLPAWRWIDVAGISDLEILPHTFRGNRPAPSGKHHRWDQLFIRVSSEPE